MSIPDDLIDFLVKITNHDWESDSDESIAEQARTLRDKYAPFTMTIGASETDKLHLRLNRNTDALLEWFRYDRSRMRVVSNSKVLDALLGDLSPQDIEHHFKLITDALRVEQRWEGLISSVQNSGNYNRTEAETPKAKTLKWLEEQLQNAKDATYVFARSAVSRAVHQAAR